MLKDFIKKLCGFSIGPILGTLINLITIPIITYFILPAEYGKVTMFTLVQSLFSLVAYLGIDQSYTRFYNEVNDKKKLLFNCIILPIILSLILSVVIIFIPRTISNFLFDAPQYITPIYILAIAIPFLVTERFLLLRLRMEEKAFKYSFFSIFLKLIIFFLTLFFIFMVRKDFLAVIYSNIIGQILGDLLLLLVSLKDISLNIKLFDKKLIKDLLKFALPLALVAVIGWLFNSMDKVFLRTMSSYEQLGLYNIAMKITNMLLIIQSSFTAFWVPIAYKWHSENKDKELYTLVSHALNMLMCFVFLGILLMKDLIPIFVSQAYKDTIYIIPFLMFYPIMYTVSETTTLGIVFSKKSYLNLIVSILSISVNLLLNFLLIEKYQAIGVSIATGISYIVFFWSRTLISRKLWYKFKFEKYIFTTLILFIAALVNVFIMNRIVVYLINTIAILAIIYIYRTYKVFI